MVINVKKVLLVVSSALIIGGVLAFYMFNNTVKDNKKVEEGFEIMSAFQVGAFTNYDNALNVAERNNGIVVSDDSVYRVYVTMLKNDEAIEKVKHYYEEIGLSYYLKEVTVSKSFADTVKVYEDMIVSSSSDTYKTINKTVIEKYKEYL